MKPIPYIPENESLTDLLDLMSSSVKFTERVKLLKELQDLINKDLGDLEVVQKVKAMQAATANKLTEAEAIRRKADEYVSTRKAEADDAYAKQMDQIQKARGDSSAFAKELDERANTINSREHALNESVKQLESARQSLAQLQAEAAKAKESADRVRGVYDEKLRQVKAAIGE